MRLAASRAAWTAGNNSPTRTPMIAITTSSSTRVKPRRTLLFMDNSNKGNKKTWKEQASRTNKKNQRSLAGLGKKPAKSNKFSKAETVASVTHKRQAKDEAIIGRVH